MRKPPDVIVYWVPVLLWMALIFSASGDRQSGPRSSRIIAPIVRWFFPEIPEETLNHIVLVARKGAHLAVYAVLSLLVWRAIRKPAKGGRRPWSWRTAGIAVLVVTLYAITDEVHQSFVPNRVGSPGDVLIDTIGGAGGMLFLWLTGRWRRRW